MRDDAQTNNLTARRQIDSAFQSRLSTYVTDKPRRAKDEWILGHVFASFAGLFGRRYAGEQRTDNLGRFKGQVDAAVTASRPKKTSKEWHGQPDDPLMDDPRDTDIIIPVMGQTGAGKSAFINTVVGKDATTVGHSLESQTVRIKHVVIPYPRDPKRRIVLLDTPGFDDSEYLPDSEILRRITEWLAQSYTETVKLSGVIYLHEISQARLLAKVEKNLTLFNKLCGDQAMKNVILATTKWSEVPPGVGERREQQLIEQHWKDLLVPGTELRRFLGSPESGWEIIERIVKNVKGEEVFKSVDAGRTESSRPINPSHRHRTRSHMAM